jgi:predicted Zn-dependent protease
MPQPSHRNRKELNLKLIGVLAVLGGIGAVAFVTLHDISIRAAAPRILAEAERAREEGKFDEAIRHYRHYVSTQPDDVDVFCQLALLEADQAKEHHYPGGEVAQVFPRLSLAVARKPDDVDLLRSLAEMAMETGRFRQAAECYGRLVSTFHDDTEMKQKYARCLMATGDFRRAIEMLQDVLVKSPTSLSAYVTLSDLYRYRLNQARQADVVIEQMVAANPGSPQARFERARCRWRAGDRNLVGADLQAVMTLTPDDPDVLFFATEVATEEKQYARAQAIVDKAQKLYPDDLRVDQALIALKASKGETEEAQKLIERFIQKQPENSRALHILAELQLQRKDVAGGRSTIKQLLRAHFNRNMINLIEAQALMQEGKWREASVLLEKLRLSFQNAPEYSRRIELFLGMCYESLGLPDRQKEAFERLLKMDPNALPARLGLASALSRSRQSDRALEEYSRLLKAMGVAGFAKFQSLRNHYYQLRSALIASLPPEERNWTELEEYVTALEGIAAVDPVDTAIMRVDLLIRQQKIEEAKKVLEASQKAFPEDSRLRNAAAGLVAQQSPERAMKMLTEHMPAGEDTVDLRLTRANLALRLGRATGVELLANLEKRLDKFSEEQQRKLWQGLALVYQQIGEIEQAKRLWRRVGAADPTDVRSRALLFETGLQRNDEALMREALNSFAQAQGVQSAESCRSRVADGCRQVSQAGQEASARVGSHSLDRGGDRRHGRAARRRDGFLPQGRRIVASEPDGPGTIHPAALCSRPIRRSSATGGEASRIGADDGLEYDGGRAGDGCREQEGSDEDSDGDRHGVAEAARSGVVWADACEGWAE